MTTRDEDSHSSPHLEPGTRIGHYEIVGPLGQGGMGVVYRARDLKLSRVVALKRSSSDVQHPDDRRRFLREARLAAQLSSPFIVPVFEILHEEDVPWIAMELVDGHTIRDIIAKAGRVPVRDAVRLAEHVSEALSVAHGKHVIHRDIKPGNIIVTRDGRARLMDFGLARSFVTEDEIENVSTQSDPITRQGIVGTLAYMSPEQVLGRTLDARTDIFSLGLVVYEMCTGRRAFLGGAGETLRDAILNKTPMPMAELQPDVPDELERIVRKMLAKDPADRYPDARSLAVDFRTLRRELSSTTGSASAALSDRGVPLRWRSLARMGLIAVAAGTAIVSVWPRGASETDWLLAEAQVTPLVSWQSSETESRISPDGEWVSFLSDRGGVGRQNIWVVRTRGSEAARLTDEPSPVRSHVWSPDGTEIAYLVDDGDGCSLVITPAPLAGHPRRRLPFDATWLVRWTDSGVHALSGDRAVLLDPEGAGSPDTLDVFPDGVLRSYDVSPVHGGFVATVNRSGQEDMWVVGADGAHTRRITNDPHVCWRPRWLGSGGDRVVFVSNRTGQLGVWELRVNAGAVRSVSVPVDWMIVGDVTGEGRLVTLSVISEARDTWILSGRDRIPLTSGGQGDHLLASASFVNRVAIQKRKPHVSEGFDLLNAEIHIAEVDNGALLDERLAVSDGFAPSLSPGGRWLAFLRSVDDYRRTELHVKNLDSGREQRVSDDVWFLGFAPFPLNLRARACFWEERDAGLLFIRRGRAESPKSRGRDEIVRWSDGGPLDVVYRGHPGEIMYDPLGEADSSEVYAIHQRTPGSEYRLLRVDVDSASSQSISLPALDGAEQPRLLGWSGGDLLIAILETAPDATQRAVLVTLGAGLESSVLDTLDETFVRTAVLARGGNELLITRSVGGTHNAYAYEIETRTWRPLTENRVSGVTFAAFAELFDGTIAYVREEEQGDIWILSTPGVAD